MPPALEKQFENALGIFLNGIGTMSHILNANGAATGPTQPTNAPGAHVTYFCKDGPPPPPPPPPPAPQGWAYLSCPGMDLKVWEKSGYAVQGTPMATYPGMRYCLDCVGRCFEQEAGKCVAVTYDSASAECTHFSTVSAVFAGNSTNMACVAASRNLPPIKPGPGPGPPSPPAHPSPPPAPPPPPPPPGTACSVATAAQCKVARCPKSAPFECIAGAANGGCTATGGQWPVAPSCSSCIDLSHCTV